MTDRKIYCDVLVPAPVSTVWRLWTTTGGITEWLVDEAAIELHPGGKYELYFMADGPVGERGSETCQILAWLPEKLLVISWNAPPSIPTVRNHPHKAWVVIEFEAQLERETLVRVTHYGFLEGADWAESHAYFLRAWPQVLDALAKHVSKK